MKSSPSARPTLSVSRWEDVRGPRFVERSGEGSAVCCEHGCIACVVRATTGKTGGAECELVRLKYMYSGVSATLIFRSSATVVAAARLPRPDWLFPLRVFLKLPAREPERIYLLRARRCIGECDGTYRPLEHIFREPSLDRDIPPCNMREASAATVPL